MRYFLVLLAPTIVLCIFVVSFTLLVLNEWIASVTLFILGVIVNYKTEALACNFNKRNEQVSESFTVMTYNLNRAYSTSRNYGSESDVVDFILSQEADVLCLQEFNPNVYQIIGEELKNAYPYGGLEGEDSRFKSVYSKYPIGDFQQLTIDEEILPICSMNISVGDKQCRLVNCHLMSNNFSMVYKKMKENGMVTINHVKEVISLITKGYDVRKKQSKMLVQHIHEFATPVVVCGDFNDVGGSAVFRMLKKAELNDVWWQIGKGFGFTFWGLKLRFRLDHFLYRKGTLTPQKVKVIYSRLSDHRPIITRFNFI